MFSASSACAYGRDAVALLAGEDQEVAELCGGRRRPRSGCSARSCRRPRSRTSLLSHVCVSVKTPPEVLPFVDAASSAANRGECAVGSAGKPRREDVVRPVAQRRHRPEVHRQRQHAADRGVAEARADDVVDVDVGAAEAVDRLLRIADDEERAGPQRHRAPVRRPCGARRRGGRRPRRPRASKNTISAWTGSVSWNSSTNRCRYFCCSARRTCAFSRSTRAVRFSRSP